MQKTDAERTRCCGGVGGGILWTGGRNTAERRERMAQNKNGSLRDLQRTTALLSGLLAKEAKALDARRREEGEGDMKALKEITAVLKDLAAVAKSLGEQDGGSAGSEYGVVLLPPAGEGKEEPL